MLPESTVAAPHPARRHPALRTLLAIGPEPAAVAAATAVARIAGARVLERRPAGRHTGRSIAALARREAADLVVVAPAVARSPQIESLVRPALDSGCTTLVIPPGAPIGLRFERVGVGYDGSPAAQRALSCAVDVVALARGMVASLDIAYVDDGDSPADAPGASGLRSARDAMIEWWLDSLADEVPALVRSLRLEGDPTEALADLSQDLDLLVVGTRPRGWLGRIAARRVSTGLLARTRCALLVVPER